MPEELEIFKNPKTRNIKAAVLASPNDKAVKEYKFYETVTANLGIELRVFFVEEEAVKWLYKKSSATN